jgi:tRNA (cmo5U34)-methyltransferase
VTEYRWNQAELAQGYDAGAPLVHPHYVEVQDAILAALPFDAVLDGTVVDLGGGSGRLLERILDRWPGVRAVNVDQSAPFLDLARERLKRFGDRVTFIHERLQGDWAARLPGPVTACVSMSAIHHLDPPEKRQLAQQVYDVLVSEGVFLNGDEVRPAADDDYRALVEKWAAHMESLIAARQVTPAMAEALIGWQRRNVDEFAQPRSSGDDCHETAQAQLKGYAAAGFIQTASLWQRDLWTLLSGRRPA